MKIKTLRVLAVLLILIPFVITAAVGLSVISSYTKEEIANENEEFALSQAQRVSDMVYDLTYSLNFTAKNEFIRQAKDSEKREWAHRLTTTYVESADAVHDILLTDSDGYIFLSYSGDYDGAELFFDENMTSIANSPTPVSGFYDGGRFYIARPVTDEQDTEVGYIISVTEQGLIEDMDLSITVSDDSTFEATLTGEIEGTKWKWGLDYPASQANSEIFRVWITAFAIAGVVCIINIIIMIIVTKKMGDL